MQYASAFLSKMLRFSFRIPTNGKVMCTILRYERMRKHSGFLKPSQGSNCYIREQEALKSGEEIKVFNNGWQGK